MSGISMKVVILAGGFGTRLSEYTRKIPKPMVEIGGKPLLWHIMNRYSRYGFKDFIIALGYKAEYIKRYFLDYKNLSSDFCINLESGNINILKPSIEDWNISLIDTGLHTMTGGRMKALKKYIGDERFMLTYGDGLADIDIKQLVSFHLDHGKLATVTAVRPSARFGELELNNNLVEDFEEKPKMREGWISGGFFVFEPGILDFISGPDTMLEREPMTRAASEGEIMAYKHTGFWQCMDSVKDLEILERHWQSGAPWL